MQNNLLLLTWDYEGFIVRLAKVIIFAVIIGCLSVGTYFAIDQLCPYDRSPGAECHRHAEEAQTNPEKYGCANSPGEPGYDPSKIKHDPSEEIQFSTTEVISVFVIFGLAPCIFLSHLVFMAGLAGVIWSELPRNNQKIISIYYIVCLLIGSYSALRLLCQAILTNRWLLNLWYLLTLNGAWYPYRENNIDDSNLNVEDIPNLIIFCFVAFLMRSLFVLIDRILLKTGASLREQPAPDI